MHPQKENKNQDKHDQVQRLPRWPDPQLLALQHRCASHHWAHMTPNPTTVCLTGR
jgi:hypothetical protein